MLDPSTDSFLVLLGNSVHPVRTWRSGSAPRVAAATHLARAVPVRPVDGHSAWFGGMASGSTATLTLPALTLGGRGSRLRCALWWDTERSYDTVTLEASTDGGDTWQPVPFRTRRPGEEPVERPEGTVHGFSGRVWHTVEAPLTGRHVGRPVRLRWRYTTDERYVGRGVYVDALRVEDAGRTVFDDSRPEHARRIEARGWTPSAD